MNTRHDNRRPIRILGLMTGSSADGLDYCLVEFKGTDLFPSFMIIESGEVKYPDTFSSAFSDPLSIPELKLKELDEALGEWYAKEIDQLNLEFDAIGNHGQTIRHEPPHFSQQIGNPSFMAQCFKKPVVYDFRTADIEEGGQGAPLIPIVDRLLFQDNEDDCLALNIGGIANITMIPSRRRGQELLAWDTGPGNTLIDKAVKFLTSNRLSYDTDGELARRGKLDPNLLDYLLSHEYYAMRPPKSAGQEQFGHEYFKVILDHFNASDDQDFYDLIHTLTYLTAKTIADSIKQLQERYTPRHLHVGGGGTFNLSLVNFLKQELPELNFSTVETQGVTASNKEAFGFAYLAYLNLMGLPGNIPSVTGARAAVTLGKQNLPDQD